MAQRYRAFLSYSHKDASFARWLHRTLEHWKIHADLIGNETEAGIVPPKLRPIFRDRDDFAGGASLQDATLQALENSDFLIVLCSPNSAKSIYVDAEIRAFKQLGRAHRVIPVIIAGEPGSDQDECFPPSVVREVNDAGELTEQPIEPIAADARDVGDGRHRATAKIVAGLLGVTFDEIAKREEQAQRRRSRIIGGVAAAMAVLAIFAGYLAWLADARRIEAERNFLAAKSAADSLLQDVAKEIQKIDELPLEQARKVLKRAEGIYDSLLENVGDDIDVIASRAEALTNFATTYRARGGQMEAMEAARGAEDGFSHLIRLQPDNALWWIRRATVRAVLLLTSRLNPDEAPDLDREALQADAKSDLAQAGRLGADPAELHVGYGIVLIENAFAYAVEKNFDKAQSAAQQAIARFDAMPDTEVDSAWMNGASLHRVAYEVLASIHRSADKPGAAREARHQQITHIEREIADDPENPRLRKPLMVAFIAVAERSYDLDDPVAAERAMRQAKRAEFALIPWDITDRERLAEEARKAEQTARDIGDVREYENYRHVAEEWYLLAAGLRERLIEIGQDDLDTWSGFVRALRKIEDMRFDAPVEQLQAYRASEVATREFVTLYPEEQLELGYLAIRLGEILSRMDRPDEAIEAYEEAVLIFATAPNPRYAGHVPLDRQGFAQMRIARTLAQKGEMDAAFQAAMKARDIYEGGIDQHPQLREALVLATSQIAPHDPDSRRHWQRILELLDSEGAPLSEVEERIRMQAETALQ